MLTVRLSDKLNKKLNQYVIENDSSKSSVVKEALVAYLSKNESQSPFELGEDLFGQEGSGDKNASTQYKQSFQQYLDEKHAH